MKRAISVLGSTGSIGRQTLEVARALELPVRALAAGKNVDLIEEQAREFNPAIVAMSDKSAADELRVRLADTDIQIADGEEGVCEAAAVGGVDTVVTAIVGTAGLKPTMAAIARGRRIALANKETLVCAGRLVMAAAKKCGAEIIPVDSEHSAIFQCLKSGHENEVQQIILTGSGGPFRGFTSKMLEGVIPEQALKHPNWTMGPKITIDSATLMNKGLEFIEAMHLFSVTPDKIKVLIHPQSVIHSMVRFVDNTVIAQMATPDMRLPIQLALTYPERVESLSDELDFTSLRPLTFFDPDTEAFPCLRLAMETAGRDDCSGAVMSAANEVAVSEFLERRISFNDIFRIAAGAVSKLGSASAITIDDLIDADREARQFAREMAESIAG